MVVQTQLDRFLARKEKSVLDEIEERQREADKKFEEWRRQLFLERLKGFKPFDEETVKRFRQYGWEYDEELSKIAYILYAP